MTGEAPGSAWISRLVAALSLIATAETAHLLALLAGALIGRRRQPPVPSRDLNIVVVIPAHDEEHHVGGTIRSVQASDYPLELRRIIVIADNCSDGTARVAREAAAEVWERTDASRRGKGFALAWAFTRLLKSEAVDAVCVIDADCEVSPNLLGALAARLRDGADAAQAAYLISNPKASTEAALRWAGFALFNVIRPLGRDTFGLSCGLLGTGMAISADLLRRSPWESFSFAEDREQHMRWVLEGAQVAFVPEASVRSPAAPSSGTRVQDARWESGRLRLARLMTPRLLRRGLRAGDVRALDAALEPVLLPQSMLVTVSCSAVGLSAITSRRGRLVRFARAAVIGQGLYVVVGLTVMDAPGEVWQAFRVAVPFVLRRAARVTSAQSRGPDEWVRTTRADRPRTSAAAPPTGA